MMIISDNYGISELYFPKNKSDHTRGMVHTLKLHSNITLKDYEFILEDKEGLSDYYVFVTNLTSLPNGEYEYSVSYDGEINSRGLIRLGNDFKKVRKETTKDYKNNTEYIQYEG